jgi:putative ABC transport system substrate-binding protein
MMTSPGMASDMERREFITLLGGTVIAWPIVARAQESGGFRKIAILVPFVEGDTEGQALLEVFRQQLRELGWRENSNLRIDARWDGGDVERARAYAVDLIGLSPDIIFAYFNTQLAAFSRETRSIPIVFVGASDPVGAGYVASLPHPGGNITGFTLYEASLAGKWLGFLKEIVPGLARVAFMINPETAVLHGSLYSSAFAAAASSLHVEPITAIVHTIADIEKAISSLGQQPGSGLIVAPDTFTETHGGLVVALAAKYQVPAIYAISRFVKDGAFVSYGPDVPDTVRRAASYVDRILRGDKPAELPVQAPTKFNFVLNMKTARALGLQIPNSLIATADEVIE